MKTGKRVTEEDAAVGLRIRTRRLTMSKTQTWLGDELGITFQQVQKYERGTNRVGAGRLAKIAELLEVPVQFFFGPPTTEQASAVKATPAWFTDFMATRDGQAMAKAFYGIKNHEAQRALLGLAQAIAAS